MARKKKNTISPVFIGIVIGILLLSGWGFWHQFQRLDEIGRYKACLEIQNNPNLEYACICRPKAMNITEFEAIYDQTEAVCICECKISENQTESFEIRKARSPGSAETGLYATN